VSVPTLCNHAILSAASMAARTRGGSARRALVKLDSPGSAFFTQERVGLHGRTFGVVKFRSRG
jgi:hypothetical protein